MSKVDSTATLRHFLTTSDHWSARTARFLRQASSRTVPVPMVIARPMLAIFTVVRHVYYWLIRSFVTEPLFKAYCREYGKNVHTDVYIHWISGSGDLIVGDDVLVDGKCSITFASRYVARPTLRIGSHSGIGHGCILTIGKSITIGEHCRIAQGVWMFDSPGHASDPAERLNDAPAPSAEVKPITIGNNVWIGGRAVIFPGVTVGEGSIVSACAVVTTDVPPYSIVAGNPARRIATLPAPEPAAG